MNVMYRTVGGPHPGSRMLPADLYWPPQQSINVPGDDSGVYRLKSHSQVPLEEAAQMEHVIIGAEFVWELATDKEPT